MPEVNWTATDGTLQLHRDVVDVVHLDLKALSPRLLEFRSILSADEVVRADRFKFEEPRLRFIASRAVLRLVLARSCSVATSDIAFQYGNFGKPTVRLPMDSSSPVEFNVSHSGDVALIALTTSRQLGVDVEEHDPKVRILKLARRFFSSDEASQLEGLPTSEQLAGFYKCWTSKEAYLKATGFGLSFSLGRFTVNLDPREQPGLLAVTDLPEESRRWQVITLPMGLRYSATLFVERLDIQTEQRFWNFAE